MWWKAKRGDQNPKVSLWAGYPSKGADFEMPQHWQKSTWEPFSICIYYRHRLQTQVGLKGKGYGEREGWNCLLVPPKIQLGISSRRYLRVWEPCTCLPWPEQQYSSTALCTLMVWGWWHARILQDFRKAASSLRLCPEVCQKNPSLAARNKKLLTRARKDEAGTELEDVFCSSAFGLGWWGMPGIFPSGRKEENHPKPHNSAVVDHKGLKPRGVEFMAQSVEKGMYRNTVRHCTQPGTCSYGPGTYKQLNHLWVWNFFFLLFFLILIPSHCIYTCNWKFWGKKKKKEISICCKTHPSYIMCIHKICITDFTLVRARFRCTSNWETEAKRACDTK